MSLSQERGGPDSNRRVAALQAAALPLGYLPLVPRGERENIGHGERVKRFAA